MKLIQVYSTEGQLEAEMIKGFLEAQGLNVTLSQESIGRTLGLSAGRLGQVKVLVPESQVTSAVELLEAMERGDFEDEDSSDFIDKT
ncbi:MAG: putative signal transducing protein [Kosmotogaceae bacterium]